MLAADWDRTCQLQWRKRSGVILPAGRPIPPATAFVLGVAVSPGSSSVFPTCNQQTQNPCAPHHRPHQCPIRLRKTDALKKAIGEGQNGRSSKSEGKGLK